MELPLKHPTTLFVRVIGLSGKTRELRAVLSTGSTVCLLPVKDAIQLGYTISYNPLLDEGEKIVAATANGVIETSVVTLQEVRVGHLAVKNVKASLSDLPMPSGIEMILGANFLSNFKITLDYKKQRIMIEE
jgi:clan AA aspartic protease (TIGR02281 family)